MLKHARGDREYSKAVRELIVQNDVKLFVEMRRIVTRVRENYVALYNLVFKNWDRFDRPAGGMQSYNMHG